MKSSVLYRIASVLLVIFAGGHTYGMFQPPSKRATIDTVTYAMKNFHFEIMGFSRSLWDYYFGFGMLLTVFLLFSAFMAWDLGASEPGDRLRPLAWGFAVCHAGVAVLCWVYFFLAPAIVSTLIAASLIGGALQQHKG